MGFAIKLGDRQLRVDDLPISEVVRIAKSHGISWTAFAVAPASDVDAFADLVEVAAGILEVDAPARPATLGEAFGYLDLLEIVDDDLPTTWSDGNPPEADQTTD